MLAVAGDLAREPDDLPQPLDGLAVAHDVAPAARPACRSSTHRRGFTSGVVHCGSSCAGTGPELEGDVRPRLQFLAQALDHAVVGRTRRGERESDLGDVTTGLTDRHARLVLGDLTPREDDLVDLVGEHILALDLHHVVPTADRAGLDGAQVTTARAVLVRHQDDLVARPEAHQRRGLLFQERHHELARLPGRHRLERVGIEHLQ